MIDLHVHTKRYSSCSTVEPERLIKQAVRAGLCGVVITEHYRQWEARELDELAERSGEPGFLLLSGFEYASAQGDVLIYGLTASQAAEFEPGWPPGTAVAKARDFGAVCIAAHPTRTGMGFDEQIFSIPLEAIEVSSVNLREHEQKLAMGIALNAKVPPVAASDAHELQDVGRYVTEFEDPIRSMSDLQEALRRGRFRLLDGVFAGMKTH